MKISDVIDAIKKAKLERAALMKWILIGLGVVLLILVGVWASKARATGFEHAVITKAVIPAVVTPAVVTPAVVVPVTPAVVTPVAPAPVTLATSSPPSQQPASGGSSSAVGWGVFASVGIFFYAVICTSERHRNREGFFALGYDGAQHRTQEGKGRTNGALRGCRGAVAG